MASTLVVKGRTMDVVARLASSMLVHRVNRRRVPDTLDAAIGPRSWPGLRASYHPEVSLRIRTVEVMS